MNVRQVIPPDTIPSVDDPTFKASHAGGAYAGDPTDRVVVVESPTETRAYPLRYLHYHEIVNDVLDGDPVAITWCPLCGSAIVYDRVHKGCTLEFGVSGKLADDDLVMYDRRTKSEWKQSSGRCIAGEFDGDSLSVRPAAIISWHEFRESYPEGVVLQQPGGESETASEDETPEEIDYDTTPYETYFESEGFGLSAHRGAGNSREWNRDDDLLPKTVVLGVEIGETSLGFPLPRVREAGGVVQTTVGDRDIVVFATDADGIHGFVNPGYSFEVTEAGVIADGTTWNPSNGRAADGRCLDRLSTRRLFAFAWQDDHGPDTFYRPT
jgi:hypothetical protein